MGWLSCSSASLSPLAIRYTFQIIPSRRSLFCSLLSVTQQLLLVFNCSWARSWMVLRALAGVRYKKLREWDHKWYKGRQKFKGKVVLVFNWAPRHEDVLGEWMYSSRQSWRWRWVVIFTPQSLHSQGKSPWYPLDRRLGGSQSRSGHSGGEREKFPAPIGNRTLEPQSYRPSPSRYTDWGAMNYVIWWGGGSHDALITPPLNSVILHVASISSIFIW
jgi:hypothetical protein